MKDSPRIAIIGCGKVGSALALLLKARGYILNGIASRNYSSARKLAAEAGCPAFEHPEEVTQGSQMVFITTPDREIATVSSLIAGRGGFQTGQVVAHASGARSSEELKGVKESGAFRISVHPLQSFADLEGARENLPGSYFALEGDVEAIPLSRQLVNDLGGKAFIVQAEDKPLYHAAACIASNYLVSLMHLSTGIFGRFGLPRPEAFEALYPLVQGTIHNIKRVGPVKALTGPIARGDDSTIQGHLPALHKFGGEEILDLYCALGEYTVRVAMEKGNINEKQAGEIMAILQGRGKNEGDGR